MDYREALAYIASLETRGWRLGLDRMEEFLRRAGLENALGGCPSGISFETATASKLAGVQSAKQASRTLNSEIRNPKSEIQFIHVAGTNGKGSVTAFLQSMLVESGYRTGAYFSPFVEDIRERIQLGREWIGKEDFARIASDLRPIAESLDGTEFGGVTEFEFKTAMGFAYWRESLCEWVALEVGLGGRLDATNVVTPRCSVITSIGLDHTAILGSTLGEIAKEKAGIIKPGVPTVVGEVPDEARRAIKAAANALESPIWFFGSDIVVERSAGGLWTVNTPARSRWGLTPSLLGAHQVKNMAVAIAAMDASGAAREEDAIVRGVSTAQVAGRFERIVVEGKLVVLDGAHNADAASELARTVRAEFPDRRIVLVLGMLEGHDPGALCREIGAVADSVHTCPIVFRRTLSAQEVADAVRVFVPVVSVHPDSARALAAALEEAGSDDLILIAGSFYLVGEILRKVRPSDASSRWGPASAL